MKLHSTNMKKAAYVGFVILMTMSGLSYATDDNQEFRAQTVFSFKLSESWKVDITEEFHFRDGEHHEQENVVLFIYKAAEWLNLGAGFNQVYEKDSSHDWQREDRPFVEGTLLKNDLFGLKWSDRNRLEFRDFEDDEDAFRYRNRLRAHVPYNLLGLPLQPYAADEIFIQEQRGLYRNRIYTGLIWDVNKTLDIDFFVFQEKNETDSGYDDRYMYGFEIKFSF
ncbi:MAG: DUF2490 domain-containing protein [Planctomycetales bacterium]|nr:DUF2490 domain-containing protein [Planctomycetales bacterium]